MAFVPFCWEYGSFEYVCPRPFDSKYARTITLTQFISWTQMKTTLRSTLIIDTTFSLLLLAGSYHFSNTQPLAHEYKWGTEFIAHYMCTISDSRRNSTVGNSCSGQSHRRSPNHLRMDIPESLLWRTKLHLHFVCQQWKHAQFRE